MPYQDENGYINKVTPSPVGNSSSPHTATTGPLSSIDGSVSEALVSLDHLENRLGLCLRSSAEKGSTNMPPKAVPESELIGRLYDINGRLAMIVDRINSIAQRVTL